MPGGAPKKDKRMVDKTDLGDSPFDTGASAVVREVDIGDRRGKYKPYERSGRRGSSYCETIEESDEEGSPDDFWGKRGGPLPNTRASAQQPGIPPPQNHIPSDEYYERIIRPWKSGDPHEYSPQTGDHWYQCNKLVEKYDADMCMVWKAEVDNLLIFAGLFSAAVTAFTIESYKWLQPDPNLYGNQVLSLIYEQLGPINTLQTLPALPGHKAANSVVRINIFWFLSLALGLTTVLIGIISAQWLREYQREVPLSPKAKLALRQMRYEGLLFWQVPRIIAMLPMFLQAGFILFLVGIIELLWTLNRTVAIPVTVVVGSVFLFLLLTVILPTAQWCFPGDKYLRVPQCPFKSPQSLAVLRFTVASLSFISPRFSVLLARNSSISGIFTASYKWTWTDFDVRWRAIRDAGLLPWGSPVDVKDSEDIKKSLTWFVATFHATTETIVFALNCLRELPLLVAQKVIQDSCSPVDPQTSEEFNAMVNLDLHILPIHSEATKAIQRDILDIAFLRPYRDIRGNPGIQNFYWESQIRVMNALPGQLRGCFTPFFAVADLDEEVHIQLLVALRTTVQQDRATPADIQDMWALLKLYLSPGQHNAYTSNERIALIFDLFFDLRLWLGGQRKLDFRSKVKLSVDGIRQVVYPDFHKVWSQTPGYEKIEAFIRRLNRALQDMGGLATVLEVGKNPHLSVVNDTWDEHSGWVLSSASNCRAPNRGWLVSGGNPARNFALPEMGVEVQEPCPDITQTAIGKSQGPFDGLPLPTTKYCPTVSP